MSKKEFDTHLRFGQGLLIQGFRAGEDGSMGLLTVKGYADKNVKYETYQDILYFQNYRDAIFQIIPAGNFEINDELTKSYLSEDIRKKLENRAKTESSQFELNVESKMNEKVFFGSNVMFKHIDSENYLTGTILPSAGDNGAFAVRVSKDLSSNLVFRLEPYRSFEFDGMPIPFGSPVKICNVVTGTYLTFESAGNNENFTRKLNLKPTPSKESFQIPIKKKSDQSQVYSTVLFSGGLSPTSDTPTPWTFKLHMKEVINDTLIQHDIGYLQHSQNQGVLVAFKNQVALKEWKQVDSASLNCYDCLWEIECHEGENEYILRHLMSGMTLEFVEKDSDGQKKWVPRLAQIFNAEKIGVVEMTIAKREGGDINSDSYVHIGKDGLILTVADKRETIMLEEEEAREIVDDEVIVREDFHQMVYEEQEFIRRDLELSNQVATHCFKIMEIDDMTKGEVLFALSFHQTLISLIEELKWGNVYAEKKITYQRMMNMNESLKEIKCFIKDCKPEDAEKQEVLPIPKRQAICKDLGMSELLFELLYYMKSNKQDIFKDSHNEKEKFEELYNTCYEVIEVMIKDNYRFKVHVGKWIDFVIEDVIENDAVARLAALKEILKGNQLLVKNFIREQLIVHLGDNFKRNQKPEKYLEIFRCFCIVDSQAVTKNQTNILNLFIKGLQGTDFSYEFKEEKGVLMVQSCLNKKTRSRIFGDYYKSAMEEVPESWAYMVEYINLLADLCYGRNKIVKNYLEKQFELRVLIALLKDPAINDAYVPVLRLIHYLYIEGADYYPVLQINNICKYSKLEDVPQINTTEAYNKPWQTDMKSLMDELMDKLSADRKLQPTIDDMEYNRKLETVLKAILTTIELGFWQNMDELAKIIGYAQNILANDSTSIIALTQLDIKKALKNELDEAYTRIKSSLKLPSKQNLLVIDCKLMATKIIECILDYELDLRVVTTCQKFKELTIKASDPDISKASEMQKAIEMGYTSTEQASIQPWVEALGTLTNTKTYFTKPKKAEPTSAQDVKAIKPEKESEELALFKEPEQQPADINLLLLELSQYSNPQLISHSLLIMKRLYDQRRDNINHFYEICFVESGSYFELAEYTLKRREKFFTLLDQNSLKIDKPRDANSYHNINKESNDEKDSGIMQDMFMLSELMKNEKSISNLSNIKTLGQSGIERHLSTDRLINLSNERESNNKLYQKIIKSSKIHLLILHYVRNCTQLPQGETSAKLLHLCFIFLTNIIANNQDNKLELLPHIEPMKVHLPHNVGVIDFFKELYDNNKNMLYNEKEINTLTKRICEIINSLDDSSFYRSKLLDFFRCLIFFNEKALQSNQIMILKIMQDDEYTRVLIDVKPEDVERLIQQFESDNRETEEEQVSILCRISPELTYMFTFFQVMSALIEGNNSVNLGKLAKRHPFDLLSNCIRRSNRCWPLRRNLQTYMNKLYYKQPGLDCYFSQIVTSEFDNFIYTLNYYIQIKNSNRAAQYEKQLLENPVRFSYMETYMYLSLEEVLNSIYEIMYKRKVTDELNATVEEKVMASDLRLAYRFIRILERLGCVRNYFTGKKAVYTVSLIKHIQSIMREIILNWREKVFEGNQSGTTTKKFMTNKEKTQLRDNVIDKICHGQIDLIYGRDNGDQWRDLPLVYQLPDKIVKKDDRKHEPAAKNPRLIERMKLILSRNRSNECDTNLDLNKKLSQTVAVMKLSSSFNDYLQKEFIQMTNEFSTIDEMSKGIYELPYISRKSYITTIIDMNIENSQALSPELKIFFLRMITRFIAVNNRKDDHFEAVLPIDEWDADYWSGQTQKIEAEQMMLKECKLADYLCMLLSDDITTSNIELANEILLCGIAFLLGGYELCQKSINEQIQNDNENKVFVNINALIDKLGDLIYKNNIKKESDDESNNRAFSTTTIDTYDFYNNTEKNVTRKNVFEPDDAKEQEFKRLCMVTYRRSFRFIQLMCENNNMENKELIREQMKEGEKKLNSIDFIQVATNELRKMFSIMCKEVLEIPIFILDFILEVTQIPVTNNQIVLMRSTFFEDLCQMENKKDTFNKDFDQTDHQNLQELYSKCVTIILSNFEGDASETFVSVDTKLEARFLTNILDYVLEDIGVKNMADLNDYLEKHKDKKFDDKICRMLDVLTIFKKMAEKAPEGNLTVRYQQYLNKDEFPDRKEVLKYLESCLLKIEITNRSGGNQVLYFPNHPVFSSLSGQLRDTVMYEVKRETRRDKFVSLMKFFKRIKLEMQHSFELENTLDIKESKVNQVKYIASALSIIIIVYMSITHSVYVEYQEFSLEASPLKTVVLRLLCLMQLGFSGYYGYLWYKSQVDITKLKDNGQFGQAIQIGVFILVSILGTVWRPSLLSLHILDLFSMIDVLKDIFAAIALSLQPLIYVSIMGGAFVMIFCSVTFSNYMRDIYSQPSEQMCTSVFSCIMQLFIAGVITQTSGAFEFQRFFYDLIYITFFGLLFGNIVSGIILGAFAVLREKKDALDSDKSNYCFICNKSRDNIEKESDNFKNHIQTYHWLWNYVFYAYVLKDKDSTDYTGIEYYIIEKLKKDDNEEVDVDWLPNADAGQFDAVEKTSELIVEISNIKSELADKAKKVDDKLKGLVAAREG